MMVSVIVPISPNYAGRRLENCVASLARQETVEVEIIISCLWQSQSAVAKVLQPIQTMCDRYAARVVYWKNPHKLWAPSLARNIGFRRCGGVYIASCDADAVLFPTTLRLAVNRLKAKKDAGAFRVETRMKKEGPGGACFAPSADIATVRKAMNAGKIAPGPGSLILAKGAALFDLHGWDERYVGYGPADWDFVTRVQKSGRQVISSAEFGHYALHQNHDRIMQFGRARRKNRELYEKTKEGNSYVRNLKWWGGLPS